MTPLSPGRRLRDAWAARPIAVPGVFNALVGRMAERLGFRAMYLSGAALSASMGLPDVGLVTLTEFVDEARRLTAASSLAAPVRRRHRLRRSPERRADGTAVRGGRRGGHSPGGPAAAEALRPPVGQAAGRAGGDGGQGPGGGGGAAGCRLRDHRPHRRPRRSAASTTRCGGPVSTWRRGPTRFSRRRWRMPKSSPPSRGRSRRRCWPT